jgi:hypothetical protein
MQAFEFAGTMYHRRVRHDAVLRRMLPRRPAG